MRPDRLPESSRPRISRRTRSILSLGRPRKTLGPRVITIRILWEVVGPEGLEPSTRGLLGTGTPNYRVGELKKRNSFSDGASEFRPKPSLCRTRWHVILNRLRVSRRSGRVSGNRNPNHRRTEIPISILRICNVRDVICW